MAAKSAAVQPFTVADDPLSFPPPYGGLPPSYWGIFENNDPKKRLVAIANVNNDISEYWEWSGTGYAPVDLDSEAYKSCVKQAGVTEYMPFPPSSTASQ